MASELSDVTHQHLPTSAVEQTDAFYMNETTYVGVSNEPVERAEITLAQAFIDEDLHSVVPSSQSLTEVREDAGDIQMDAESPVFTTIADIGQDSKPPATNKSLDSIPVIKAPQQVMRPKTSPAYPATKRPTTTNIVDVVNASKNFDYERYKHYKQLANQAVKDQKVFTVLGGYPSVCKALLQRGWLQRLWDNQHLLLQQQSQHSLLLNAKPGNEYEMAAISKLLNAHAANFVWYPHNIRVTKFDHVQPLKSRMNRPPEMDFVRKDGLVNISRAAQWLHIPGKSELACPRSYRLYLPDELNEFMADYRFTGCTSLLAFLVDGEKPNGQNVHFTEQGPIPIASINFAIKRVREQIRIRNHDDVDGFTPEFVFAPQWRAFFRDFHSVCRLGKTFRMPLDETELKQAMVICRDLVKTAKMLWPHVQTDGFQDIWILKQSGRCRGVGVSVMADNLQIVQCAKNDRQHRYIVQKYLERPFLIHNTKFDIRQYFLIVGQAASIQVWVYKACYLKFSSQEFSLRNYHESVHLTNHFVQKNYSNSSTRSAQLPACNMWSSDDFQAYLKSIGKPDAWSKKIYPSIRQNIVAACRASYEELGDTQKNCFEVVGADFMITESLDSLLLEVNATPDMAHSTPITAQICPEMLRDVVKVVVDRARDPLAPTGKYEMAYEIPITRGRTGGPLVLNGSRCTVQYAESKSTPSNPVCKINTSPINIAVPLLHPAPLKELEPHNTARSSNKRPKSSAAATLKSTPPKTQRPTTPPQSAAILKNLPASLSKTVSASSKTTPPKTCRASTSVPTNTLVTSAIPRPSTPPPVALPHLKGAPQSRQVLEDLAKRLRNKQSTFERARIRPITPPSSGASDIKGIKGLGDEVNRLMDLNETIERLLLSRSSSEKERAGMVNQFLGKRQKKREMVW